MERQRRLEKGEPTPFFLPVFFPSLVTNGKNPNIAYALGLWLHPTWENSHPRWLSNLEPLYFPFFLEKI
jgi:hypothetical protein